MLYNTSLKREHLSPVNFHTNYRTFSSSILQKNKKKMERKEDSRIQYTIQNTILILFSQT